MSSDLIRKIESLNSKDFESYKLLIYTYRKLVMDATYGNQRLSNKNTIKQKADYLDYKGSEDKIDDYLINCYNNKLQEFFTYFFWGEQEKIREVIKNHPQILDEVTHDRMYYFDPIMEKTLDLSKPSAIDASRSRKDWFKARLEEDYFNKEKSSEGCFVATYAYGSYENKEVLFLREFRDKYLKSFYLGKIFIKVYYLSSPLLVKFFKQIKFPPFIIRKLLNPIIIILKRSRN
jgi:hypothetical protein